MPDPQTAGRQSGQTSRQMLDAPKCAVFVWPVPRSVGYARDLARHLEREDLQITVPTWLEGLRGQRLSGLVLDHACSEHLTPSQWRTIERLEAALV